MGWRRVGSVRRIFHGEDLSRRNKEGKKKKTGIICGKMLKGKVKKGQREGGGEGG